MRLPDGPERDEVMRQAKDMLRLHAFRYIHQHHPNLFVQPWTRRPAGRTPS
jgi:hypothetical protein